MSARRLAVVFAEELGAALRRPLFWIVLVLLALLMWGLSAGNVRISSGDASVGGKKAVITSMFAVAMTFSIVITLFYTFVVAVVAGMSVIRDDEQKVGELLHATPLRPGEYVWGKFLGVLAFFGLLLGLHVLITIVVNHVLPSPGNEEYRGPFAAASYLVPALVFGVPLIVFLAGGTFALGERLRRPIVVFVLPVAVLLVCAFFLWEWSPSWLDPRINRALMLVDPAGFRWLNETWLKVDRGAAFYNAAPIGFDAPFLLSRLVLVLAGLVCVAWSHVRFSGRSRDTLRASPSALERELRAPRRRWPLGLLPRRRARGPTAPGTASSAGSSGQSGSSGPSGGPSGGPSTSPGEQDSPEASIADGTDALASLASLTRPLAILRMVSARPGFFSTLVEIARTELRELRTHPGLYLFAPLILLQTLGTGLLAVGAFDTPVLMTPGTLAVRMMNTLTLLLCLLLLFYQTESLQRERSTGIGSIYYSAPSRSLAILAGKTLANSVMASVVLLACLLGSIVGMLIQRIVPFSIAPFVLVWGLLLLPTLVLWCAFTTLVYALTRNRYTTYGIALAALTLTGYLQLRSKMTWTWNWDIWDVLLWSDMGRFEIDRWALLLNRLGALGLAAFFLALAVRLFPRRDLDPASILQRLAPRALLRSSLRFAPLGLVPVVACASLWVQVNRGFQGKTFEKKLKDYWKQNLATWNGAPLPDIAHVDLDLSLEPEHRSFHIEGSYELVNTRQEPLARFPLTGGPHWKNVTWTVDGKSAKPEERTSLFVFTPERPLAPGDRMRIGFRYDGVFPPGITKNGGGAREFILPSGVVLTSFSPSFVPVLGYMEEIGVEEDKNRYEPKAYPEDFYKGLNEPMLAGGSLFTTRIRVAAPEAYALNSVGALASESVAAGIRTAVWESDQPVRFFNVVAGRWREKQSGRTRVFHDPEHAYNVDEISAALQDSLANYSEWFCPFPWKELKVSEFPALASYAQGFPTNITFSEGIGFLTLSDPRTQLAYFVTAHETAHQWWGNILMPGKGPGGNILAEGMAHYSTILLLAKTKGERGRIEFCKRIEERYGDRRQADSERPLVKIDGSRPGDESVTYDKGGWVFWMLTNLMGREAALAGVREFIAQYRNGPDYPLLQDFVEVMRRHAPDSAAFDDFTKQWFFDVVVPEYKLADAKLTSSPSSPSSPSSEATPEGAMGAGAPRDTAASDVHADTAVRAESTDHTDGAERSTTAGAGGAAGHADVEDPADAGRWTVTVHVTNVGKGRMPVEVAAVRGERFKDDGAVSPDYLDVRTTVLLGAGEGADVTIACPFKPERIVVDPDARLLQLKRKSAVARLS